MTKVILVCFLLLPVAGICSLSRESRITRQDFRNAQRQALNESRRARMEAGRELRRARQEASRALREASRQSRQAFRETRYN